MVFCENGRAFDKRERLGSNSVSDLSLLFA